MSVRLDDERWNAIKARLRRGQALSWNDARAVIKHVEAARVAGLKVSNKSEGWMPLPAETPPKDET